MAISAVCEYKVHQYDIVAAYSNSNFPQPILAYLPEGFQNRGNFLLIKKAVYELPESALFWQNHLGETLIEKDLNLVPGLNCLLSMTG